MSGVGVLLTGVAQLVERSTFNRVVRGSIPLISIIGEPRFPLNPSFRRTGLVPLFPKVDLVECPSG